MTTLRIVANDTPRILIPLTSSEGPVDVSDVGTIVVFKVKNAEGVVTDVPCTKLIGFIGEDGVLNTDPPYDVAGFGGRCVAVCDETVFTTGGNYTAETEVTFPGDVIATVYKIVKIHVRDDFQN